MASDGAGAGDGEGCAEDHELVSEASRRIIELVSSGDRSGRMEAAREIRRLTKSSSRHRRQLSGAVEPLVSMLSSELAEESESALLALLNLAVRDERNKIKIVEAGALDFLIGFLRSANLEIREYATAVWLTLSACPANKSIITTTGAIPLLVQVLRDGSQQARGDALLSLYNLSTLPSNLEQILSVHAISPLIALLKSCKKSSKTAEKCVALVESLLVYHEARTALTAEDGGVLTVVEVIEDGSLQSREHAVGALLTMCESDRVRYREAILGEGVIPGLLELTVQGTPRAQLKANTLLQLLRDSSYPRSEFQPDTLENIVSNIVSQIEGDDRCDKAKKMLAEMVQVSMEQSLRHLKQRALICTPTELPIAKCASEVISK